MPWNKETKPVDQGEQALNWRIKSFEMTNQSLKTLGQLRGSMSSEEFVKALQALVSHQPKSMKDALKRWRIIGIQLRVYIESPLDSFLCLHKAEKCKFLLVSYHWCVHK